MTVVLIPKLRDPIDDGDMSPDEGAGWWWAPCWIQDPPIPMLYIRTPSGATASLLRHQISPNGTIAPSVLVRVSDGNGGLKEDWHIFGRLEHWNEDNARRYAKIQEAFGVAVGPK